MIRRVAAVALGSVLALARSVQAQVAPSAPEAIAVGEWQLVPLFEIRTRGEYRHDLDDQDRGMLTERVRIGVEADRGPVRARVALQDARALNLAAATDAVEGPVPSAMTGAYEAWAEARNEAAQPNFVRVGRQPVIWGEGRLLGAADWSAAGRSLDAVRGRLVFGDVMVEVLGAILEDTPSAAVTVPSAYGELFGLRGQWTFNPLLSIEAYALARLAQANPSDTTGDLEGSVKGQTIAGALRFSGEGQAWSWGGEIAGELGHVDLLSAHRAAWAMAAHVARTIEPVLWTPTVRVGLAYASGNDGRGTGATYRAFDPLFADMHVWHGAMDVFAWSNEEEANARLSALPFRDGQAAIEYRYARLAQTGGSWRSDYLTTIGASASGASADLGHEVDASIGWSPWTAVAMGAGYSVLLLGDGARAILGAPAVHLSHFSHFAWAQTSVTF